MILERNKDYTLKALAEFFEVTHLTMQQSKNKKGVNQKCY